MNDAVPLVEVMGLAEHTSVASAGVVIERLTDVVEPVVKPPASAILITGWVANGLALAEPAGEKLKTSCVAVA